MIDGWEGEENYEKVGLDELPRYQPQWVQRLLGFVDWEVPERDISKIENEYNQDKYESLLKTFKEKDLSLSELRWNQLPDKHKTICFSNSGRLFKAKAEDVVLHQRKVFFDQFSRILSGNELIIELGAGYGLNLGHLKKHLKNKFPNLKYIGGEYSENAVELGNNLFEDDKDIELKMFNYYEGNIEIPNKYKKNCDVIIFTSHSVEQIPKFNPILDLQVWSTSLNVSHVVHFEPVYEFNQKNSLIGMLRRRYTEINDYNRDIYSSLKNSKSISIRRKNNDLIGINPLNPTSLIHWEPADR